MLREAVECCAAAETARNISQAQLDRLEKTCRDFDAILAQIRNRADQSATAALLDRWLDCEERFHRIVVEAARNSCLAGLPDGTIGRLYEAEGTKTVVFARSRSTG